MKKRLFYVIKQWLNSPISFLDITTEVEARRTVKEFVSRCLDIGHSEAISKIEIISVRNASPALVSNNARYYKPIQRNM